MTNYNDGLLLYYKPSGITSNHTIQHIKRHIHVQKIGHAGTLDKFAEGLLLVLTGKTTKLSDYLMELEKEYLSTIHFGKETDTLDKDGTIIKTAAVPSKATIETELEKISGTITQTPPAYSAVHIQGARASDLARKNICPHIPSKTVSIYENTLLNYDPPDAHIRWKVSKGTYIRALAQMLGENCSSCAYLTKLIRTKIGDFSISHIDTQHQHTAQSFDTLHKGFIPLTQLLSILNHAFKITITDDAIRKKLKNGIQPISLLTRYATHTTKLLYVCDQYGLVGAWKVHALRKITHIFTI